MVREQMLERTFHCPRCGNQFAARANSAICDGVVVLADRFGNPIGRDGSVLPPNSELVLVGMDGTEVKRDARGRPSPILNIQSHHPTEMNAT